MLFIWTKFKMKLLLYILALCIISIECNYIIQNTLKKIQKLKTLEKKNSELISDGLIFSSYKLSYYWYENHSKRIYWNIKKNTLYIKTMIFDINVETLLYCNLSYLYKCDNITYFFISTQHRYETDKMIKEIITIVNKRLKVLI